MTVEDKIECMGFEDVVIFKNPDYESAFIGISDDGRAVYDFDLMVQSLMKEDSISDIDAIEFIEYNTIRALPYFNSEGNGSPIILHRFEDFE